MTDNLPIPTVPSPSTAIASADQWWNPKTIDDALAFADRIASSSLVPKDFMNRPGDIMVAWSYGAPLGLGMLSCLQHIAVINGRPSIWGDGALAVVQGHPAYEWHEETIVGEDDQMVATARFKRRGAPVVERTYSARDAMLAGNWGKKDTYRKHPKRMLQMRARAFALRDGFSDALCGMAIAEESRDITEEVTVETAKTSVSATDNLAERLDPKVVVEPTRFAEVAKALEDDGTPPPAEFKTTDEEPASDDVPLVDILLAQVEKAENGAELDAIVEAIKEAKDDKLLKQKELKDLRIRVNDKSKSLATA